MLVWVLRSWSGSSQSCRITLISSNSRGPARLTASLALQGKDWQNGSLFYAWQLVITNSDDPHLFLNPHFQVAGSHCNLVNVQKGEPVTCTHTYVFFWEKSHSCNRKNENGAISELQAQPNREDYEIIGQFSGRKDSSSFKLCSKWGYMEPWRAHCRQQS